MGEDVTHASEVALTFFAYVGGKDDGDGWGDAGVAEGGGDGEEASQACAVVADAGGIDSRRIGVLDGFAESAGGKDGVEVSGDEDAGSGFGMALGEEFGNGVAFAVEVGVREAKLVEATEEPVGAVVFAEGWGWDADELELPGAELRLVEMQPMEGAMDGSESGESCDSALGGGGGHQYWTSDLS
jgi:hypothetical protein